MRALLILGAILTLSACGGSDSVNTNTDGSSKTTYSSCKITSSEALFAEDRSNDLTQCWNATGNGYESQGDAMQWCNREVNAYIAEQYTFGHTVAYAVESTNCT